MVPVRSLEECKKNYTNTLLTDNMFCADNGAADSCTGDSGGPAVLKGKLVGIITWGKKCASKKYPGIYTRVDKYYKWIESKTGINYSN